MYFYNLLKSHFALVLFFFSMSIFAFCIQLQAQGGIPTEEISIEISYQPAAYGRSEVTCIFLQEDVVPKMRQIVIIANLPEEPTSRNFMEVDRIAKQILDEEVSITHSMVEGQAQIVLDMPSLIQFKAGELLRLRIAAGRISPVAVRFVDEDGIVVVVNIDDFRQAAASFLEIRNSEGRIVGTFNRSIPEIFADAYRNLAPGLYFVVDPQGFLPTQKYLKL